ncbi:MAG: cyclic nucleotide-binding domain-containing protein [Rhizobiales bacterium]|nr:cyclic nucleotide-binding domain-containing protein [Hyphomicrobiales bacterium]
MAANARRSRLSGIDLFSGIPEAELARLEEELTFAGLARGDVLMRQGEPTDALYIVVSGRLSVHLDGRPTPIAEIGPGRPVGEIGFLSGRPRVATVKALRDSLVLRLDRASFDRLLEHSPAAWKALAEALANRLMRMTTGEPYRPEMRPRTIAVCPAGGATWPPGGHFLERLAGALARHGRVRLLTSHALGPLGDLREEAVELGCDPTQPSDWLNTLEGHYAFVVYVTDADLSDWSRRCIRQADEVLLVGNLGGGVSAGAAPLNAIERYVAELHAPDAVRLVLRRPRGQPIAGTRHWLAGREIALHHHVAGDSSAHVRRLVRFICGEAVGLVASGGGAYCAAQIGCFKALGEAGVTVDMVGGTSGGSAMAVAFALGVPPDEINRRVGAMFVAAKALGRLNWPTYGLLDHKRFDAELAAAFGSARIEDIEVPFFAVATNLSSQTPYCLRTGRAWEVVRASSAIPGLLPPFFTPEGEMLVDGAVLQNVPVEMARALKRGPNIVLGFDVRRTRRYDVDYSLIPSRMDLVLSLVMPHRRRRLPVLPSATQVLMRSLMIASENFENSLAGDDLLVAVPVDPAMSLLDWRHHTALMQLGYEVAMRRLEEARGSDHPAVVSCSAPRNEEERELSPLA